MRDPDNASRLLLHVLRLGGNAGGSRLRVVTVAAFVALSGLGVAPWAQAQPVAPTNVPSTASPGVVSGFGWPTNVVSAPVLPVVRVATPRDPLEGLNRAIFRFNEALDFGLLKPLARAYRDSLPSFVRTGVNNFFGNLYLPWSAVNNLLQGKPGNSGQDILRFGINWYMGFGGVIDVGGGMGLESTYEDFGQTLAVWGVDTGPYLVVPFFGPSTLRDASSSFSLDWRADAVRTNKNIGIRNRAFVTRAVDARSQALRATEVIDDVAIDKYQFVRDAFLQLRQNQVYDGNPPLEAEDDLLAEPAPAAAPQSPR
jgi:phospholipid-binding lipoprotein MlaA